MSLKLSKECIEQCIKYIKEHLHISYDKDIIVDFTAKNGEFIEGLQSLVKISLFYDNEPSHPEVKQLNFLNLDFDKFNKTFLSGLWFDDVHVIVYPPENEVEEYIDAACNFAQSISCILPNKKSHYIFPSSYICIFTTELDTSLMFQIWMKADY